LKAELLAILDEPYERMALEYFDFISWIDSRIEHVPFAEVKKRKYEPMRAN